MTRSANFALKSMIFVLLWGTAVDLHGQVIHKESWLADFSVQNANSFSSEGCNRHNVPDIPEPMVFDLVRGLGARKGEFEINVLAEFPFAQSGSPTTSNFDPGGLTPGSSDLKGIEWAPEIEYAVADGLAFEFEMPFEDNVLESYKFASQLTFQNSPHPSYIHGSQVIVQPNVDFDEWNLTFLYLAGIELNERWSMMGMIGARPQIESGLEYTDGLLNLTAFLEINEETSFGLESNFVFGESDRTSLLLMPQIDRQFSESFEVQAGAGALFSEQGAEGLAAVRVIYNR